MKLFERLKQLEGALASYRGSWAICGGVAACLYREVPRYTGDIDIAMLDHNELSAHSIAEKVLAELGYIPKQGWVTNQKGELIAQQALVIGREGHEAAFQGIDFLLPTLPWVKLAVTRAQSNLLDYGFARIPTITAEDLILAKLYASQGTPGRKYDLDDVCSILSHHQPLDLLFLRQQTTLLDLALSNEVKELLRKLEKA